MEELQANIKLLLIKSTAIEDSISQLDAKLNRSIAALDTKVSALDSKINSKICILENKIDNLSKQTKNKFDQIDNITVDLTKSQEFIARQYEEQKVHAENLLKKDTARDHEISKLIETVSDLRNQLGQECISRNQQAQYHRTSLNIVITGVLLQPGEEDTNSYSNPATAAIVENIAKSVKFSTFHSSYVIGANLC